MKMSLFRRKKSTDDVPLRSDDPYLAARLEHSNRFESFYASRRNWQLTALAFAGLAGVSMTMNVIQVRQVKLIPYLVVKDRYGSFVTAPPVLRPYNGSIDAQTAVSGDVWSSIRNVRSVSEDPTATYDNQELAMAYVTGEAANYVGGWVETHNPFKVGQTHAVEVHPVSEQPLPNRPGQTGFSWQMRWVERYYHQGRPTGEPDGHFVALVHADIDPTGEHNPVDPLNIKISVIEWAPELVSDGHRGGAR
jgi:type IV secretory pathway TrbF-like protein